MSTAELGGEASAWAGLRRRALRGGLLTLAGHGLSQALRLAGNLILTRLLFPEAFGLMALARVFMQGVKMFSDVGVRGSLVYHPRGEEESFRNTAWTIQVLRGAAIWATVAALAWPAASFYGEPMLLLLLPVIATNAILHGFQSTSGATLLRRLSPGRTIALDLVVQGFGLGATVAAALWTRSVWALVVGGVLQSALYLLLSHFLIRGYRNRFAWDPEAARAMFRFGRWILLGTALSFLIGQGDRLVLGKLLSAAELGVYSIAFFLVNSLVEVTGVLSRKVIVPLYARVLDQEPESLRSRTRRVRGVLLGALVPAAWLLILFGEPLVGWLYDERYVEAGWMVEVLAVGAVGSIVTRTASPVLLAAGDSGRHLVLQVARAVLVLGPMLLGGLLGGLEGLLVGLAAGRIAQYPVLAWAIRPYGVWLPSLDLPALAGTGLIVALRLGLPA